MIIQYSRGVTMKMGLQLGRGKPQTMGPSQSAIPLGDLIDTFMFKTVQLQLGGYGSFIASTLSDSYANSQFA